MPEAPWTKPTGVKAVVEGWLTSGVVRPCVAAERLIPANAASYAPIPEGLSPAVQSALASRGVTSLYTHQVEAIGHTLSGRHTVVSTPTASGKSLCFHVPVLEALAADPGATALYLYPTKALSR